ncbi:MAG: redox-sensing transcriptional repressor Rex [Bacillota bacterium]
MLRNRIPDVVIHRLIGYLRVLQEMQAEPDDFISSAELGEKSLVNSAQVRKDLALFGEFGKQGVGYPVRSLLDELTKILRADRDMAVSLFGVGELGTALVRYLSVRKRYDPSYRFTIRALFDEDKRKIGTKLEGLVINPLSELPRLTQSGDIKLSIITVPASAAQEVVNFAVACGIRGFLNFAPVKLKVPPDARVQNVDVTFLLQELAFYL